MTVKEYISRKMSETLRVNQCDRETLIGLPHPYNVPCAEKTFNELYYWDTYFTNKALFVLGDTKQAKNNVENILYLINRFGYMPNGSRTYLLLRSQPPYAALMVSDIFKQTGDTEFLRKAFTILKKEYDFWMTHRGTENGLNHYGCENDNKNCAEFYFNCVVPRIGELNRAPEEAGRHYLAEAESGWDFTPRFGGLCADYNPVDLNSNLYIYETLFSEYEVLLGEGDGGGWRKKAQLRAKRMNALLLNEQKQAFMDYNYKSGALSPCLSAASFQPYFVGVVPKEYRCGLLSVLKKLESRNGVYAAQSAKSNFQWAYPNVWAPNQYIAVKALERYGYYEEAKRIAQNYILMIERNYEKYGKLFEKYNGLTGDVDAISEYGTPEMLGWTAGVYLELKNMTN